GIVSITAPEAVYGAGYAASVGVVQVPLDGPLDLALPDVARWWPHTHGEPTLHELAIVRDGETIHARRIGFRDLAFSDDIPRDGLDLRVNGVPIWARGAVWTPA